MCIALATQKPGILFADCLLDMDMGKARKQDESLICTIRVHGKPAQERADGFNGVAIKP